MEQSNKPILVEIFDFLKDRKAWWLVPIVITLIFGGLLIVFGHSSAAVSPFIYPLF